MYVLVKNYLYLLLNHFLLFNIIKSIEGAFKLFNTIVFILILLSRIKFRTPTTVYFYLTVKSEI